MNQIVSTDWIWVGSYFASKKAKVMYPVTFEVKCEPNGLKTSVNVPLCQYTPISFTRVNILGTHYWKKLGVVLFPYEDCYFNYSWDIQDFDRN